MKLKYTWIPFVVSLLLLIPVRVYQVTVGKGNAFGTSLMEENVFYLLFSLLCVFVLLFITMSLLCKNVPETVKFQKNILSGIFATVLGIVMAYEGINELYLLFISIIEQKNAIKTIILSATTILASFVFLILAFCQFYGKNIFLKVPVMALVPTVWAAIRLILIFMYNTSIASTAADMLDVLAVVFLLLFLFTQARMLAGMDGKNIPKRLFAFGMSAVLLILLYDVPILSLKAVGVSNSVSGYGTFCMIDLLLAAYIVISLIEITDAIRATAQKGRYSKQGYRMRNEAANIRITENLRQREKAQQKDQSVDERRVPDSMLRTKGLNNKK